MGHIPGDPILTVPRGEDALKILAFGALDWVSEQPLEPEHRVQDFEAKPTEARRQRRFARLARRGRRANRLINPLPGGGRLGSLDLLLISVSHQVLRVQVQDLLAPEREIIGAMCRRIEAVFRNCEDLVDRVRVLVSLRRSYAACRRIVSKTVRPTRVASKEKNRNVRWLMLGIYTSCLFFICSKTAVRTEPEQRNSEPPAPSGSHGTLAVAPLRLSN